MQTLRPVLRVAVLTGLSVALAAPVVHAQGGRGAPTSKQDKPHLVTSDSVERLNPISPLIARRRELGIPDSLVGKLGTILSRLDATNARGLRQVDSLAGHSGGPPVLRDEARREGARGLPGGTVTLDLLFAEISRNNDAAAAEVLTLLSGKAADRARDVMNDQKRKLTQLLRDSRGSSR